MSSLHIKKNIFYVFGLIYYGCNVDFFLMYLGVLVSCFMASEFG
jgi:hypothetical protein